MIAPIVMNVGTKIQDTINIKFEELILFLHSLKNIKTIYRNNFNLIIIRFGDSLFTCD